MATEVKKEINEYIQGEDPNAYDPYPEKKQVDRAVFRRVISMTVSSIDIDREFDTLMKGVPRNTITHQITRDVQELVMYQVLSNQLVDLARLRLPIAYLYERYKYKDFPAKEPSELATATKPPSDKVMKEGRYVSSFEPVEK